MAEYLECSGSEAYDLGRELADAGAALHLRVRGLSMFPFVRHGDVIEVVPIPLGQVQVGDIILVRSGGNLFAHRVIRHTQSDRGSLLVTRGDTHNWEDVPVDSESDVIGRVRRVFRAGRAIRMEGNTYTFLGSLVARSRLAHLCVRWTGGAWLRGKRLVSNLRRRERESDGATEPTASGKS